MFKSQDKYRKAQEIRYWAIEALPAPPPNPTHSFPVSVSLSLFLSISPRTLKRLFVVVAVAAADGRSLIERAVPALEQGRGHRVGSEFWRALERRGDLSITLTQVSDQCPASPASPPIT